MTKPLLRIERYSHGARVSKYSRDLYPKLTHFLEQLALKEPRRLPRGGMVMELKKRFYGATEDRREIYVHRNTVPSLINYLKERGIASKRIEFVDIPLPETEPVKLKVHDRFVPRDYQVPIIETLSDPLYSRRLDLQTGLGKTLCALMAVTAIGKRVVIMLPPKYFGIWIKALDETYQNIEGRYTTVSGSAELQQLIEMGVEHTLDYDLILVSSVTYRNYIESYERLGEGIVERGYLVPPTRFHECIRAGVQINDEIQEDPGLVFRTDVFTNVAKQMYLSATPFTGSEFVTRMIDHMLPAETQCPLPDLDVYINVVGILYNDTVTPKDYLVPYKNTYNHARYEKRMLKSKRRQQRYFEMVAKIVNGIYITSREPGQKLLILCATVAFIHKLTKYLQDLHPDLQIGAHVAGSDYRKLQTNDITVSTIKSAGTGQDIINLRETLLLQATGSEKDNIQILGRLRRLRDWKDVTPRMTYLACMDIPQAMRYHLSKREYFDGRVLNHKVMRI